MALPFEAEPGASTAERSGSPIEALQKERGHSGLPTKEGRGMKKYPQITYMENGVYFPTDARIVFCGHWGIKLTVTFVGDDGKVHANTLVDIESNVARDVAPPYIIEDARRLLRKLEECGFTWEEGADTEESRREAEQVSAGIPFDQIV